MMTLRCKKLRDHYGNEIYPEFDMSSRTKFFSAFHPTDVETFSSVKKNVNLKVVLERIPKSVGFILWEP